MSKVGSMLAGRANVLPPALSATKEGHTRIIVRAKPGARRNAVLSIGEEVEVQIAEQARDGKANAQLCEIFADLLALKKTQVSLDKGMRSRDKVVLVQLSPEDTLARLTEALEER
jgi:uncharacterized protein (TIGR00251 family)